MSSILFTSRDPYYAGVRKMLQSLDLDEAKLDLTAKHNIRRAFKEAFYQTVFSRLDSVEAVQELLAALLADRAPTTPNEVEAIKALDDALIAWRAAQTKS